MMQKQLMELFTQMYGEGGDIRGYFAPGRVNLIGEHTDYNGGHVFPCALTLGTYGARKKTQRHNILRFYSMNLDNLGVITVTLEDLFTSCRIQLGKLSAWELYGHLKRKDIQRTVDWIL